jgi:hypothetical protein
LYDLAFFLLLQRAHITIPTMTRAMTPTTMPAMAAVGRAGPDDPVFGELDCALVGSLSELEVDDGGAVVAPVGGSLVEVSLGASVVVCAPLVVVVGFVVATVALVVAFVGALVVAAVFPVVDGLGTPSHNFDSKSGDVNVSVRQAVKTQRP